MKNYKNNSWYSVILALLMVWFMMILVVWVFRLVLVESKDTFAMENYLKAFAWAESSIELALLKAKQNDYSINFEVSQDQNSWITKVLAEDRSNFFPTRDVKISYELNSASNSVEGDLDPWSFKIIPLFWNWIFVKNLTVSNINDEVVWNILSEEGWISWTGDFDNSNDWNYRTISWNEVSFTNKNIWDFLNDNSDTNKMYLILNNTWDFSVDNYKVLSWDWEYLTNVITTIIWSWEIWDYKQNLRVKLNSWEYLNLLKYSLFSK